MEGVGGPGRIGAGRSRLDAALPVALVESRVPGSRWGRCQFAQAVLLEQLGGESRANAVGRRRRRASSRRRAFQRCLLNGAALAAHYYEKPQLRPMGRRRSHGSCALRGRRHAASDVYGMAFLRTPVPRIPSGFCRRSGSRIGQVACSICTGSRFREPRPADDGFWARAEAVDIGGTRRAFSRRLT